MEQQCEMGKRTEKPEACEFKRLREGDAGGAVKLNDCLVSVRRQIPWDSLPWRRSSSLFPVHRSPSSCSHDILLVRTAVMCCDTKRGHASTPILSVSAHCCGQRLTGRRRSAVTPCYARRETDALFTPGHGYLLSWLKLVW
ncbi:hypothetical protein P4O66_009736 [Electrophorus voltai]|uniref:Uncharacterized protein n=1 Tax=Electrophorus voltai TaxID=2609070 RepID=A0AAD8ZCU8_9TELE|nr:hypothetical protein P4O66_009736 [Electrophorus voltai]